MRGRKLLIVTAKTLVVSWLLRIMAWVLGGSSFFSLHGAPGWLVTTSTVMFFIVVGNVLVIATWNLAANLREADQVIKDACEELETSDERVNRWTSSIAFPIGSEEFTQAAHMCLGRPQAMTSPTLSGAGFVTAQPGQYHQHLAWVDGFERIVRAEAGTDGWCTLCRDQRGVTF